MYYHKQPYASNFEFIQKFTSLKTTTSGQEARAEIFEFQPRAKKPLAKAAIDLRLTAYEGDVYALNVRGKRWKKNYAQSELEYPARRGKGDGENTSLVLGKDGSLTLSDAKGKALLRSISGKGFGVCGNRSLYVFEYQKGDQFFGGGEKILGMEMTGKSTKFWNTDVWADFPFSICVDGVPDPLYVAIPYLIIKRGNTFIGLLMDNPYATFVSLATHVNIAGQMDAKEQNQPVVVFGAEHGQPNLTVLVGPSLAELTRKLQKLVGTTPMPPAWALGYQQCRWGYASAKDLESLDANFRKHEFPCDGLWLDIGYMDGYRVFTFDEKLYPKSVETAIRGIQEGGRHVVPIIDPGVKAERGYSIFDSGMKADVFCKNPQGQTFIGLVWPGETAFPDFSIEEGRQWWANHVTDFASIGLQGAWLDMNDPSTGRVDNVDMLFDHGRESHYTYHNQYALGMAKATRDGFEAANPNIRPFLLSRSGFTGISKYSALWTGDNFSNYHYLKHSIACSLNLALSGVPFNGPDIGGFGGDSWPELIEDWTKTCFLFPFCRNHAAHFSIAQEPWAFKPSTLKLMRHYVRLRYRLRPYLYNLFVQQEEIGEAILRPLMYDFTDTRALPLATIDDQFLVGPAIMQAPIVEEKQTRRAVVLPKANWYSAMDGKWIAGGRKITVQPNPLQTPLYFREGSIVPMAVNATKGDNTFEPTRVEFHLFLRKSSKGAFETEYVFDDGETLDYREGERSRLKIRARVRGGKLVVETEYLEHGFGACDFTLVVYDNFKEIELRRAEGVEQLELKPGKWNAVGTPLAVWKSRWVKNR